MPPNRQQIESTIKIRPLVRLFLLDLRDHDDLVYPYWFRYVAILDFEKEKEYSSEIMSILPLAYYAASNGRLRITRYLPRQFILPGNLDENSKTELGGLTVFSNAAGTERFNLIKFLIKELSIDEVVRINEIGFPLTNVLCGSEWAFEDRPADPRSDKDSSGSTIWTRKNVFVLRSREWAYRSCGIPYGSNRCYD